MAEGSADQAGRPAFWRHKVIDGAARAGFRQQMARITGDQALLTMGGDGDILNRLERELRVERSLARTGHHSYDLNRHIELLQASRAVRTSQKRRAAGLLD